MSLPITISVRVTGLEKMAMFSPNTMSRVHRAMAMRFKTIAMMNFGVSGVDRPTAWKPYARNYPKWGKREGGPATLIRTTSLLGGILTQWNSKRAVVSTSPLIPYANRQQFGGGSLPPRPYFPITGSMMGYDVTPYTRRQLEDVAVKELREALS